MKIKSFNVEFSREQFVAPFGFKGAYLSEMWQSSVNIVSDTGKTVTGYGAQSVLWSDPEVFTRNPEAAGNAMMLMTTSEAARASVGVEWKNPLALQRKILRKVHRQAGELTGRKKDLRLTFTLNSMVALDNAAWLLMSKEQGISSF
ncbi:MAG: L-alanine-DL-glutamate epimerase, partial [Lentisphaerota bacterium]